MGTITTRARFTPSRQAVCFSRVLLANPPFSAGTIIERFERRGLTLGALKLQVRAEAVRSQK